MPNKYITRQQKEQMQRKAEYEELVQRYTPKSEKPLSLLKAFIVGGLICVIGQAFYDWGKYGFQFPEDDLCALFSSFCLIFLSALFTGLGWYDLLGRWAGAGSIVPITGFANSIVSPAMEFKREGYVMGVGAKMFIVAGPVLVYGISTSVIVGLIYAIIGAIF